MATTKQKIELNFTDEDDFHFKSSLRAFIVSSSTDSYTIFNDDLSIRANGKTPKEAAENIKEQFMTLANDIFYKSQYTALSERERKKLNIIKSICDII